MNEEADKPDALLWLDFETTGIDRASSLPLEVGMECTDVLGEQSFGSLTRIIRPASLDLLDMSPVAFSMHTDNGLLFELLNSSFRNDSIGAVANAVEEYLDSLSQRFTLIPAGTNVDFDMAFLARLNLRPSAWLSYRKLLDRAPPLPHIPAMPGRPIQGPPKPTQSTRLHPTRHQRLQEVPRTPEREVVMDIVAVILLCAAILIGWMANRP